MRGRVDLENFGPKVPIFFLVFSFDDRLFEETFDFAFGIIFAGAILFHLGGFLVRSPVLG